MSGIVVIFAGLLYVIATVAALIFVFGHFSFPRLVSVLGCSFLVLTSALFVIDGMWVCAFGCFDANIPERISATTIQLDSVSGYIVDGTLVLLLLSWLLEMFTLYRQHRYRWFWSVALIPPLLWSVAVVVLFTHLPSTEQELNAWVRAILVASLLIIGGHLVTLSAAFRSEKPLSLS